MSLNSRPVVISAPSNIALIKYMGKKADSGNQPLNASLSYTLERFRTWVYLEEIDQHSNEVPGVGLLDSWYPFTQQMLINHNPDTDFKIWPIEMSESGKTKFLKHLDFLKTHFGLKKNFKVYSGNNFPSGCGIASSASSFAALTMAVCQYAGQNADPVLSRHGSGSSIRSFFPGWVQWQGDSVFEVSGIDSDFTHEVVLLQSHEKEVSSSQAHSRVQSSLLLEGRAFRAETRLKEILLALKSKNWSSSIEIAWNEFMDMHALFETSRPPFTYMTGEVYMALEQIRRIWKSKGIGPIVTMDAGSNIHLLYPEGLEEIRLEVRQTLKEYSFL